MKEKMDGVQARPLKQLSSLLRWKQGDKGVLCVHAFGLGLQLNMVMGKCLNK